VNGTKTETVILCEGYHDRAFWGGWLLHVGCTDPGKRPNTSMRAPVLDPWGTKVVGGNYAYHSKRGAFLRVVPCHGIENVLPAARDRLGDRGQKGLRRLIINIDTDTDAAGRDTGPTGMRKADLFHEVLAIDPHATQDANGHIAMDGGATMVCLIRWEVGGGTTPGVPNRHTLERVICSALARAYPARPQVVENWLASRPGAPTGSNPKEHSWSYMAGWYAEHHCDDFFFNLWRDQPVVPELRAILEASEAWQLLESISNEPA
jgi:hypothetical protein